MRSLTLDVTISFMSHEDWLGLSDDKKKALYDDYEADRREEIKQPWSLTNDLCFRKMGGVRKELILS